MQKYNLFSRVKIEPDMKLMYHQMKEGAIGEFNNAVKKGASPAYLTSLYRQTKRDLVEFNRNLSLLPQDGLSRLNWSDKGDGAQK